MPFQLLQIDVAVEDLTQMVHGAGEYCHQCYHCLKFESFATEKGNNGRDAEGVCEDYDCSHEDPLWWSHAAIIYHLYLIYNMGVHIINHK